jgi:hypothetical protein
VKKNYPVFGFLGAIIAQMFLLNNLARFYQTKDSTPPDNWFFENAGLAGVALLLVVPVIRRGVFWQRIIAGILCLFPVYLIIGYFDYAFTELNSR